MLLQAIIFITGGATLALELLASRILTPYFGVSLYIWSGILSITLVSLALGYWMGGRLAGGKKNSAQPDRLAFLFALMPAIAALAIVAACLVYPYLFYRLARLDLVFGAFIACLVLLCVPLLAASAMNPLLVAILLRRSAARNELADAGAGRVFFVSTIGAVAGVLLTVFGLIPYLSNFAATLAVAAILATLPLVMLFGAATRIARRKPLTVTAAAALAASLALLAGADAYTGRMWPVSYGGASWTHEASYRSLFGTVKVLRSEARENGQFSRIYFQDGLIQNMVDSNNQSMSLYTYALEALSYAYRPGLNSALVLGIGAGMVPMRLAGHGIGVTTVDIDPASLRAAAEVFGFDPVRTNAHQADARTFLRECRNGHDVVIVDLFHGDGVPDYLVTRDFFRDLKRCLGPDGIAVFNTFADLDYPRAYAHFLTTLRTELPYIVLHRPDYGLSRHINSFVVAGSKPLPPPSGVDLAHVPPRHHDTLSAMLRDPRPLDQKLLEHGRVITDARNTVAEDMATSQIIYRRNVVEALPAAFLVN
ncbi:MAG: fused MFS/spermidine synthase [Betaproteobacteria bacterium]|nr:fused MFS/spermidine synthase [Betaproteobacteria bacterium]